MRSLSSLSTRPDPPGVRLAFVAACLGSAHAIIATSLALVPNPEGWAGGVLYAAIFVLPAFLVALALRSRRQSWPFVAGWSALALAIAYLAVIVGNWPGYSAPQSMFAVAVTAPTALAYVLIFWGVIVRRGGQRLPRPRTT